ncbi:MAG TPA: hypothetical protein VGN51_10205 [Acidimicrobiia bacterium]|jgi:hypothetical protein
MSGLIPLERRPDVQIRIHDERFYPDRMGRYEQLSGPPREVVVRGEVVGMVLPVQRVGVLRTRYGWRPERADGHRRLSSMAGAVERVLNGQL